MGDEMLRVCIVCNKYFTPKSLKMVRCSERCRRIGWGQWAHERNQKIKQQRYDKAPIKQCKNCKSDFKAVPINRVFCNKECRESFVPNKNVDKQYKHKPKVKPFKDYILSVKTDTPEQKEQHRIAINEAVQVYLNKGGTITKCESLPDPSLPSVGSKDWEWEKTVGLSYFGSEEYTEPDHLNEEHLTSYGNRFIKHSRDFWTGSSWRW
ncbi:MAG: hypothetical protein Unbinned2902contig1001_20 [Prokaryotic dsDNA virus sp.]|nr:MAG: hypothetical protein Unbinned2902contig1001_20 [Prokaryotic dsDNA virus sp.]|tara:strand:- start:16908 stop:17531 length:624 start_codon:yes stop_codon:yes gene_type:complete